MEDRIIDELMLNSARQAEWVKKFAKKRALFEELRKIDAEYYVGIKGLRGVGKTVLMLQMARETKDSMYFSADSVLVKPFFIYEIVKELIRRGFRNIFIDEVHRKAEWDRDIKTLYDEHGARVIFSGSSALDMTKTSADLSRRVVLKELRPVSFREFLNIRKGYGLPSLSLGAIVKNKGELARKYAFAFEYMREYSQYGGVLYPKEGFLEALENSLRKVVLQDMSALRDINVKYETDVYKLLHLVAKSPPFEVNYSRVAKELEISKTLAIRMVKDLEGAGIIITVLPCGKKGIDVKKEPKIYLTIPLREFFGKQGMDINKGASREEFFVNHVRGACYLKGERGEKTPDFRIEGMTIEVGGESKKARQNPDYIASDGLSSEGNKIPLFLFGFLY